MSISRMAANIFMGIMEPVDFRIFSDDNSIILGEKILKVINEACREKSKQALQRVLHANRIRLILADNRIIAVSREDAVEIMNDQPS